MWQPQRSESHIQIRFCRTKVGDAKGEEKEKKEENEENQYCNGV